MHNPDPKKYRIKKLRGGGYILVDRQILRWRKKHKQVSTPQDAPECSINDNSDSIRVAVRYHKFFED